MRTDGGAVDVFLLSFTSAAEADAFWTESLSVVEPRALPSRPFVVGLRGEERQYISCACWRQGVHIVCVYAPREWRHANFATACRAIETLLGQLCRGSG